jgi:hypothetical protein
MNLEILVTWLFAWCCLCCGLVDVEGSCLRNSQIPSRCSENRRLGGVKRIPPKVLRIRGGLVPQVSKDGKYWELFRWPDESWNTTHWAGHVKTLIPSGSLSKLSAHERDPFVRWWNEYLEKGPTSTLTSRVKPYYVCCAVSLWRDDVI